MSLVSRTLKATLPAAIYVPLRRWATRLLTWKRLMGQVRGATAVDGFWLWLSFLLSPISATSGLSGWRDPVLLHGMVADVPGIGRFRLRPHSDDLWHVAPFRERVVLECIQRLLRPGDCFVDAGANIGFYTIGSSRLVGPRGSVLAIEMLPGAAQIVREHVELNGASNVLVLEGALSARENEVIVASVPVGSFGQASIHHIGDGETVEVRTTTLAVALRDFPTVRLIKIDIEGAELEALKGGESVLDRVQAIIFEHLDQHALEQISSLLGSSGFRIDPLDGRNSLAIRL